MPGRPCLPGCSRLGDSECALLQPARFPVPTGLLLAGCLAPSPPLSIGGAVAGAQAAPRPGRCPPRAVSLGGGTGGCGAASPRAGPDCGRARCPCPPLIGSPRPREGQGLEFSTVAFGTPYSFQKSLGLLSSARLGALL